MGHTVPSQRKVTEDVIRILKRYKTSLRKDEQHIIDQFIEDAYRHVSSVKYANSYHTWFLTIISILLEIEKRKQ